MDRQRGPLSRFHGLSISWQCSLSLRLVDAQFGVLTAALRYRELQPIGVERVKAGASASARRLAVDALVAVAGTALNHVEETFAAGDVEPATLGVEKQVVGVAGDFQVGDGPAALS